MNWITDRDPVESGPKIISAERPRGAGKYIFTYVAFFDIDSHKWYKYDPFVDNFKPTEAIEKVVAWGEGADVFAR